MRSVGIIIFPDVELLDVAGPLEVFSVAARQLQPTPCSVVTLGTASIISSVQPGVSIQPHQVWPDWEVRDCLIIPGGLGIRSMLDRADIGNWITEHYGKMRQVATVCTGAWWLASLGLLSGRQATTHHLGKSRLLELSPSTVWSDNRVVTSGHITTSGGVAAGIDMALQICAHWWGSENAHRIADYMEYLPNKTSGISKSRRGGGTITGK